MRVDTLYLGNGGPGDPDRMRGVATLGGRTINVRAISTYWPNPTDQALPEQALQGRVQALSVAFAYRLKRKIRVVTLDAASEPPRPYLALARRRGFGAGFFDCSPRAFGLDGFGGGFLAMRLRMNAEIAP